MSDRLPIASLVFVRFFRSHWRQVREPEHIPSSPLAEHSLQLCHDVGFRARCADRNWVGQRQTGAYRIATPKLEESLISRGLRGRQTEPGASGLHGVKGRSAGSVLQTVPWRAWVLWPPNCLSWWLLAPRAARPPAPAPFSVLADLPGRPRTVPTCRPSPVPAPPVSPALPTPKAAPRCASPLERAAETKKTTDPTLLGRGTLPVTERGAAVGPNWRCRKRFVFFFFLFCCGVLLVWPSWFDCRLGCLLVALPVTDCS